MGNMGCLWNGVHWMHDAHVSGSWSSHALFMNMRDQPLVTLLPLLLTGSILTGNIQERREKREKRDKEEGREGI